MLPDLGPEYRLPQLGRGDENAKKWEKEWQQCLHDWWDVPGGRPPLITSIHTQMKLCLDDVSHNNVARDALELVKLNTCALQEKLSDTAICMLVHYFESRWEEAPTAVRETLILGSLVRITRASQDDRHWCPEATVELLVQDGDNGLLAMLCHFTQPVYGAPSITKPILLPHPTIDAHLELVDSSRNSDAFLFEVEKIRVRRAAFFTELLLEVLHATKQQSSGLKGLSTHIALNLARDTNKEARQNFYAAMKQMKSPLARPENREKMKDVVGETAWCTSCHQGEREVGTLHKCGPCAKAKRAIFYCSRACQRMDWRQGALYPHKRICGRLLELGDSERVERPRLEPASFVDFFHDYELIVDVGGTLQKRPVMFADDEMRMKCHVFQRYAKEGKEVVAMPKLFDVLSPAAAAYGISDAALQYQLEQDIGLPCDIRAPREPVLTSSQWAVARLLWEARRAYSALDREIELEDQALLAKKLAMLHPERLVTIPGVDPETSTIPKSLLRDVVKKVLEEQQT